MHLDPDQTALIIVDMQNGFCHPEASLHSDASQAAIEPCGTLADRFREAGADVVYTRDVHTEEQFEDAHHYDEFESWGRHVMEGTWDAEIVDELKPRDGDRVVEKHTYDAFYRTGLNGHLETHGIRNLVFCGTLANVCVFHTAASAGLRDYRPVVIRDAVGYLEEEDKECALDQVEKVVGEIAHLEEVKLE